MLPTNRGSLGISAEGRHGLFVILEALENTIHEAIFLADS